MGLEEEIKTELAHIDSLSSEDIASFDVRDYELRRIIPAGIEELKRDWEVYQKDDTDSTVEIAIGKKWAHASKCGSIFDFDYDASLFSACIYQRTILRDGDIERLNHHKYKVVSGGIDYRGDTMNSWSTTLDEFIRKFGKEYFNNWNGRYIPAGYNEWYDFLSEPGNYKAPLPSYITEFMEVVYTIGNFIPVPIGFNSRGDSKKPSKDYWDLALLAIYNYYKGRNPSLSWLVDKRCVNNCQQWLDGFAGGWNDFVKSNCLQPFVSGPKDGPYGQPLELWDGHSPDDVMPQGEEDFKNFFTNATKWIKDRGDEIVKKYLTSPEEQAKGGAPS